MNKFKSLALKIFTVPLWLLVILCVISGISLVCIFLNGLDTQFYAYIAYFVSAYTLTALCFFCVNALPSTVKTIRKTIESNKYYSKFSVDKDSKIKNSLYLSVIINFVYIFTNAFSALYYKTAWFGIFAVYYATLMVMRVLLAKYLHNKGLGADIVGELKRSKACSVLMLTLNLALTATVLMMMYQGRGFEQHGVLIYVIALYTFYSTITAVIDVVKYNRFKNPIISASNMIKLSDALISMLLLETSMLAQFGQDNTIEFKRLMISFTGGGIAIIITFMSVYLFVQSNRQLKQIKK